MNRVSDRLEKKLELARPSMQEAAQRLWDTSDAKDIYPLYLEQMHMVVRSGVGLMQTAARLATKLTSSRPLKLRLINYLEKHIDEEKGHDLWLLEDYQATGHNPDYLLSKIPSSHVANMAGAQYYWIMHHHPVMVMGHIAALETNHPPAGFSAYLSHLTGFPAMAFRAIFRHEKLDIIHKAEILDLLNQLDLTPREETAIGVSALHTMDSGISVLSAIRDNFNKKTRSSLSGFSLCQNTPE